MTLHTIATGYRRATSLGDLELAADEELYAGGTDLVPLARAGLLEATSLVDLRSSGLSREILQHDDRWVVGALATLADLERHSAMASDAAAIGASLRQAATPQIRNRATVAGTLLQRPRCSYFRDPDVACWMKGGEECPAKSGENEYHGLTGGECVAVQPSDLASVLVALDATISIGTPAADGGGRRAAVTDFLVAPTDERRSFHTLQPGEVIESIDVPRVSGTRSTYLKAMNRAAWQFALVGVAAVVNADDDGIVRSARLVASGVAGVPWELSDAGHSLVGRRLDASSIARAADASVQGLSPLTDNSYKLPLLAGLVRRSLEHLASPTGD